VLEHRGTPLFIIGISILLIVFGGGSFYLSHKGDATKIQIAGSRFSAEIADTPMARERGLSGRDSLAQNKAMLFIFDGVSTHCFWMSDMKFSIDIVWLNEQNQVTSIEKNVSPETYPKNFCHDGHAVIEFAAGTADRLRLQPGDHADL
jgi:uncharacterized protein